jgi:FkbM family methyltransferase
MMGLSTQSKLRVARALYHGLRFLGFADQMIVRRAGVRFHVDLREGIELSLFLFGGFQRHVGPGQHFQIPPDAVIFDIGANVGAICLPLAASLPASTVYAFEPTEYAFTRLQLNLSLNPELQGRVHPVQAFASDVGNDNSELVAYSSWRVDHQASQSDGVSATRHAIHGGTPKPAARKQISLDDFISEHDIDRLDYLKIDTDGHELQVLRGAAQTLRSFRPIVIFELTKYLLKERGVQFSDYEDLLLPLGYRLVESRKGSELNRKSFDRLIPDHGSIDVLALPNSTEST